MTDVNPIALAVNMFWLYDALLISCLRGWHCYVLNLPNMTFRVRHAKMAATMMMIALYYECIGTLTRVKQAQIKINKLGT